MSPTSAPWLSLAVALGCGLLIGIERERRKGSGPARAPAGVRTFSMAALAGAITQLLEQPLLVAAGAALLVALTAIHQWRHPRRDPGITTALSLFVTFLLGVIAATDPMLAGAGAVIVAVLLAARSRLHRFATEVLTEAELRDALILAGAALVVLPLLPARAPAWLPGLNPRALWQLVLLLLALQAAGYIGSRLLGARTGLALSGLAAGFVSSTATFAAMGAQARRAPDLGGACASGALLSNLATVIQIALVCATISRATLAAIAPLLAAGAIAALAAALPGMWRSRGATAAALPAGRVFDLPRSLAFAVLLTAITWVLAWVNAHLGAAAARLGATLAGFVDVHAAVASGASLVAQGGQAPAEAAILMLLALSANSLSKLVAAWVSGGGRFALRVAPGLAMLVATPWAAWALWPGL
ncbi:MAG: DUF4010 domain-containing protein [Burkholderiales bacterium]